MIGLRAAFLLVIVGFALPAGATAEQASQPSSAAAGQLDAGGAHTCALLAGAARCWGLGSSGQLGYGKEDFVGDDESPGTVAPVDLGAGRTATAISAGDFHTCAVLDDGNVRCWGFGEDGRLGYANENDVGDDEPPGSRGPVNLGLGRTATAISAGGAHTCAVLDNGSVRCWGFGEDGRLGYGDPSTIGDDEPPASVGPVDLGPNRTATAISAGGAHTCTLLDDRSVRCWGTNGTLFGGDGRLGYGNAAAIGDDEPPGSVGPVDLGTGRTATAITAGDFHTCAVLDGGNVRCWGLGVDGRLGYGNEQRVGDNETPGSVGPVNLGPSRTATAVSAGSHTCARLDDGTVRCWGPGTLGRLGYGNTNDIGDNELLGAVGPVDLGPGRTATAISAGDSHTCAKLDDVTLRCWGEGEWGRLGYGNQSNVGDDETPGGVGPVDTRTPASIDDKTVSEGDSGERTVTFTVKRSLASGEAASVAYATANGSAQAPADYAAASGTLAFAPGETTKTVSVRVKGDTLDEPDERFLVNLSNPTNLSIANPRGTGTIADDDVGGGPPAPPPDPGTPPRPASPPGPASPRDAEAVARRAQASRLRGLRACLAKVRRHARREIRRARRLPRSPRARARRHARRHQSRLRSACRKRWGRTPGRVTGLRARDVSAREIVLRFKAAGTHGRRPPAARGYLVKQSLRPIGGARDFRRAPALCGGSCRFPTIADVGGTITLRVIDLQPRTSYYYSIAARDNVSHRLGPRSRAVKARTR